MQGRGALHPLPTAPVRRLLPLSEGGPGAEKASRFPTAQPSHLIPGGAQRTQLTHQLSFRTQVGSAVSAGKSLLPTGQAILTKATLHSRLRRGPRHSPATSAHKVPHYC